VRLIPPRSATASTRIPQTCVRLPAARRARVVDGISAQVRAQGMPGARCARSRACSVVNTRVSHHGHTGTTRHSPRNGFNGFLRALPGDRALLPPSSADCSANLTPASGRQDHTTSPSAGSAVRLRALPRPSHPAPNVRDDGDTPLFRDGMEQQYSCFYLAVK
jgi:hypothetical protein